MRFRTFAVLLLTLLLAAPRAFAEMRLTKRFSLDAEARYRSEIVNKDFDPNTGFNEFSTLRSQLGATFVASRTVTLRFKIKETRYLGTTIPLNQSSASLDFQEAYVKLDNAFGSPFTLRFGRFEAAYGRNRIMGSYDWHNYGPFTYDGIRLELKKGATWWHLFYAKIAEGSYSDTTQVYSDPTMFSPAVQKGDRHLFVFAGSMLKDLIQPLVLVDFDERMPVGAKKRNMLTTAAVSSMLKTGKFAFEGDGGYQLGTWENRDVSSWLASADLSLAFTSKIRPKIGLGADVTSGNKRNKDKSKNPDHVFYTPFGSRHIYKGYMDYFTDEAFPYGRQGLMDTYFRFSFQPGARYGIELTGHNFAFMENAKLGKKGFSTIGQEVDTRLIAVPARGFEFQAGYSAFLPSDKFATYSGDPDKAMGQYIYVMLIGKL